MLGIEKERQTIINDPYVNTAQIQFKDSVQSMEKDIISIHIQNSLTGDIDLSLLDEFNKLQELTFQEGKITSLINFPKTLQVLRCHNNILVELQHLPASLLELDISSNYLTTIDFGSTPFLEKFYGTDNRLLTINNLACTLKEIYIDDNQITEIDLTGLDDLKILHANNNKLISLKNVPKDLKYEINNNPMAVIERSATGGNKLDTSNKIIYLDALNLYMKKKKQYEKKELETKKKIKNQGNNKKEKMKYSNKRPACINCRRFVGTIFKKTENNYIAICGDDRSPCDLDINLFTGIRQDFEFAMNATKQMIERTKQLLVKQKMDTLFSYLKEKDSATQFKKRLEEYLGESKQYLDYVDFYNKFHNNMNRTELIKRQTEKVYEIKGRIKDTLEEYKKDTFNKSILNIAVNIQKNELIPELSSLRRLKYDVVEMINDELNEKEYPISSFVDQISSPQVIKFVLTG